MNGLPAMFEAIFENAPVGLVIVNPDITLRMVNRYMFEVFSLTPRVVHNEPFGNIFNCTAIMNEGDLCGHMEKCPQCPLRSGLNAVLRQGINIPDSYLDHDFRIEGAEHKKHFKISASRVSSPDDMYAVVSFADITLQKEYEQLLVSKLSLDLATGSVNKYALLNILKALTAGREDITIGLLDFDNFKKINDSHGHVVGDKVLNIFCHVMNRALRSQDILGRFGGEEFMLIFHGRNAPLMARTMRRVSASFQRKCSKELGFTPTFSAGITEISKQQMTMLSVESIISEADTNLYLSKSGGKNKITIDGTSTEMAEQPEHTKDR